MTEPEAGSAALPAVQQVYGQLSAFDPEKDNISTYLERVELYLDVNGVVANKRVAVLLTVVGAENYGILRSLVAPDRPRTKTYAQLVKALKDHFEPKPIVIAERFKFYRRNQNTTETVLEYAAELRRLAITCDFGTFLDEALRDRFVCGLKSEQVQKGLLAEEGLTMARALELAQAKEAASREAKDFKGTQSTAISKLSSGSKRGPTQRTTSGQQSGQQPCHRCGRTGHTGQSCKFKESKCHKCHNKGHIAAVCRSSKKRSSKKVVKRVIEDDLDEDESDIGSISVNANSQGRSSKPIDVTVEMSGKDVVMELDTGAAVTIMSLSTFKKLFPRTQLRQTQLVLKTYTGQPMEVVGEVTMSVNYQNQAVKSLDLVVVKEKGPTLLGRDWLKHIQLDWKTI